MVTSPDTVWFPSIFGLPHGGVSLKESKDPARHQIVLASRALGLSELPFVSLATDRAGSFSQAIPHGKDRVDLSGADAFKNLILPLSKASDHARSVFGHGHGPEFSTVFARAAFSVAVLNALMILIEGPDRTFDPVYSPWVRVIRQEPNIDRIGIDTPFRHYAIDAVHIDFLDEYLEKNCFLSRRNLRYVRKNLVKSSSTAVRCRTCIGGSGTKSRNGRGRHPGRLHDNHA